MSVQRETAVIVDLGEQHVQLIAKRVRESRVYCRIAPGGASIDEIEALNPKAIILSGGPKSVFEPDAPRLDPGIFSLGVPVLTICYGAQLMCHHLGGRVDPSGEDRMEEEILVQDPGVLLGRWEKRERALVSSRDLIYKPPAGFAILGRSDRCPAICIGDYDRRLFALQLHPDEIGTEKGRALLDSFLLKICGFTGTWDMSRFAQEKIDQIKRQAKEEKAVSALSGGVDSAVATTLVHRAIGDRLTCIFVDTGLLRTGEAEEVKKTFAERMKMKVAFIDARRRFIDSLRGVADPEKKRKIIGHEFIRVFEEEANRLGVGARFLVQGTLYPDVAESGSGGTGRVKTHHNVGGLPSDMEFELIEPLKELFKDEVRTLGKALGLPDETVNRQPFPGPGLAVRIIGEVTEDKLEIVRAADSIARDEISQAGLGGYVWQSFAVLTGLRSVGVTRDERSYGYTVAVRAVVSDDGMTADWAKLPYDVLDRISSRISREVPQVNRVVYDISKKPPATIEWE